MVLESFAATAIGSLPFTEPEQALELIWQHLPDYPHWPQLPQRTAREHFVYQYLYPLVEMKILKEQPDGKMRVSAADKGWEDRLTDFYTAYLEASEKGVLPRFAMPRESAAGFYAFMEDIHNNGARSAKMLKGQVSGPMSVALYLYDQQGKSAYYNPEVRDVLVKTLALNARWQAQKLKESGLPAMIFIDDPAVAAVGTSTFVSVNREEVVSLMADMIVEIKKEAQLVGVHACAGVDWSIFVDAGFDIISFDADQYFDSIMVYPESIRSFLEQGKYLAWGAVPTTKEIFATDEEKLLDMWRRHKHRLIGAGIAQDLLRQVVVTPSCGAGTLSAESAERIYRLNGQLSAVLRKEEG